MEITTFFSDANAIGIADAIYAKVFPIPVPASITQIGEAEVCELSAETDPNDLAISAIISRCPNLEEKLQRSRTLL